MEHGRLIVDKTITLQGAVISGTITYAGTDHTLMEVDTGAKTGRMDISGFWLLGGDPNFGRARQCQISRPRRLEESARAPHGVREQHSVGCQNPRQAPTGSWTIASSVELRSA